MSVQRDHLVSAGVYLLVMAGAFAWLAAGKPMKVVGLFAVSGLATGSLYALGGIGLVVLYRASGVLNIANGAMGAAGVMAAWQLGQWGLPGPLTWIAGIALATALSLTYGRAVAPMLSFQPPVVKAAATLGAALIILGAVNFFWVDDVRKFSLPSDAIGIKILGLRVTLTRLIVFLTAIAVVIAIQAYLSRSVRGLQMRSLANNRHLSALRGVPILKVETLAWGISGLLAGFTGLMFGDLIRLEPTVITFMVIPSIAAA
ncbi:MAG: branched-chain amino acid ABC transporter permease, partial [Proteobacteria bacterium]|nr:branched-chain amino acid ABC transporter permease [Pseudomonadota bacterium]